MCVRGGVTLKASTRPQTSVFLIRENGSFLNSCPKLPDWPGNILSGNLTAITTERGLASEQIEI